MDGFINVLKPPGLTSHDVVAFVRARVPGKKVGHGGTLDPGAAGVLPILLGKGTRFFSYLVDSPKIYRAELFLGLTTDSADAFGKTIACKATAPLSAEEIEKALVLFAGEIQQMPPMFSAVKQKGKRLYEYARHGITVERKPRTVHIFYLKAVDYFAPERIMLEVKCSRGTYIRTLCSQIGDALGFGGYMSFLLRTAVGSFTLPQACTLEELNRLASSGNIKKALLPLDFPFKDLPGVVLEQECIENLLHGRPQPPEKFKDRNSNLDLEKVDGNIVPVYTTKGNFAGLGRWQADHNNKFILVAERIFS